MKQTIIQRGPTLILKVTLLLISLAALAFCGFMVYLLFESDDIGAFKPVLLGVLLTSIPFFFGTFEGFKLLGYIDANNAFSDSSIRALKKIKIYAIVVSSFYVLLMPYIYYIAERDDAPGGILMGMVLVAAPAVVAVIAATLQQLLRNAIDLKSENDLTV